MDIDGTTYTGAWLQVDIGQSVVVEKFTIEYISLSNREIKSGKLAYSTNGTTWYELHDISSRAQNYTTETYTISKTTAENFVRMFKEVYKMDVTILRWMNASGPRQHLFPVRKFVPLVICQALLNKDIQIDL